MLEITSLITQIMLLLLTIIRYASAHDYLLIGNHSSIYEIESALKSVSSDIFHVRVEIISSSKLNHQELYNIANNMEYDASVVICLNSRKMAYHIKNDNSSISEKISLIHSIIPKDGTPLTQRISKFIHNLPYLSGKYNNAPRSSNNSKINTLTSIIVWSVGLYFIIWFINRASKQVPINDIRTHANSVSTDSSDSFDDSTYTSDSD